MTVNNESQMIAARRRRLTALTVGLRRRGRRPADLAGTYRCEGLSPTGAYRRSWGSKMIRPTSSPDIKRRPAIGIGMRATTRCPSATSQEGVSIVVPNRERANADRAVEFCADGQLSGGLDGMGRMPSTDEAEPLVATVTARAAASETRAERGQRHRLTDADVRRGSGNTPPRRP